MARKPAALARELLRNFPKGRRSAKRRRSRKSADPAAVAAGADGVGSEALGTEVDADAVGAVDLEDSEDGTADVVDLDESAADEQDANLDAA